MVCWVARRKFWSNFRSTVAHLITGLFLFQLLWGGHPARLSLYNLTPKNLPHQPIGFPLAKSTQTALFYQPAAPLVIIIEATLPVWADHPKPFTTFTTAPGTDNPSKTAQSRSKTLNSALAFLANIPFYGRGSHHFQRVFSEKSLVQSEE
jgi:hypothetical protein